jgi:hypothetical protein
MTKSEFKQRWESNEDGGGITYDDIAKCAIAWGITATPKICPIFKVRYAVLVAAGVSNAEDYRPEEAAEEAASK